MRWFGRWFGGGGLSNSEEGVQASGPGTYRTESGVILTDERAMGLSPVWSSVRLISETIGSFPLGVYEKTPEGRRQIEDHFLYDLFRVAPNPLMTPLEFREAMTMQLALWGNAYAVIERNERGVPFALTPLRADCMTPVREAGTVTYHYTYSKGLRIFAKESIFHLKGFSVDGIVGLSPLDYARHTMGIAVSADKFASKSFQGSGRYRGFISVDSKLTPDQRKQISDLYNTATADDSKTWVFEAGARFNQTTMSPDVMQMLGTRQFQLSDIGRIFRIPPHLLYDMEKQTSWGTGIEQQQLAALAYSFRPYLVRWESVISNSLLTRTERRKYFVEHSVEGLLRADSQARAAYYSTMVQNGLMTRNEVRRKENMPPVVGGDDLTIQVNLTPVDQLPRIGDGNQSATN